MDKESQFGRRGTGKLYLLKAEYAKVIELGNQLFPNPSETDFAWASMLAKGLPLPSGVKPDAPVAGGGDKAKPAETAKSPSDAELDRALGFVEKVWRRLLEIMVEFQRDMQRKS